MTRTRFHMTHVTYEFHWMRPTLFMSLWYIQCKPCTYLASRLALSPNGPNRAPPEPRHLGDPLGASYMISEPMVRLTQTMHLSGVMICTISEQYDRVRPKRLQSRWYVRCKPCTHLAPTLTLSLNRLKRDSTWRTHLRVPSGASKTIYEPMVHSVQTKHQSWVKISTIYKRSEQSSTRPSSPRVPSGASKTIYEPMVHLTQTEHYLTSTLTLSQNRLKRDSSWLMSPRSSIRCVQNYLWAYGTFDTTRALSYIDANTVSKQIETRFLMTHVT
jgi:hypothetical protein